MADESLEFHRALTDLIRTYQFRDRNLVCDYDVTVTESHALDRLVHLGALAQNALARILNLDKSTVSRLADGLVKKELARRRPHPTDGRSFLLEPTARGRRLCSRIEKDRVAAERKLLADFSPEMLRAAAVAITRIARTAGGSRPEGPEEDRPVPPRRR